MVACIVLTLRTCTLSNIQYLHLHVHGWSQCKYNIIYWWFFSAKKQFGCDAYEQLERIDPTFQRPLCITGPNSDKVAQFIAETPSFNFCNNLVDVLATCSKVFNMALNVYNGHLYCIGNWLPCDEH